MADQSNRSTDAGNSSAARPGPLERGLSGVSLKNLKPGQIVNVTDRLKGQGFQVLGLRRPRPNELPPSA